MGSEYYVTYTSSEDLSAEVSQLLSSIEESFSVRVEGSVVSRINAAGSGEEVTLTQEEAAVLLAAFEIARESDGAFDPAILPLVKAWGFDPPYWMNGEEPPSATAIAQAKSLSDLSLFELNNEQNTIVKSDADACIDLGAAIKGYAAERVRDLVKDKAKEALVYVGGTIAAVGKNYEIGVTPPRDSEESFAFRFTLQAGEICATSGDYERFYIYDGVRYHHILDAKTGYPASSGVISATVVSEDGLLADALATAVVVLGAQKGAGLLKKCGAKGAIVTEDKKIINCGLSVTVKDMSYEIA